MKRRQLTLLLLALALAVAACEARNWRESLTYSGPVEIRIEQGAFIAGTDVQYLGETSNGAQILIGEQRATKRTGDSLSWEGEMAPGVRVDLSLRIISFTQNTMQTAGTIRVTVQGARPVVEGADTSAPVHYVLPVAYRIDRRAEIPGTTITYEGKESDGARLGNIEGYPYRRIGDSILWQCRLLSGLWLDLAARTALIGEDQLDVVGTADLWIRPQQ